MQSSTKILIVGAGNLGLATGIMLQKKGYDTTYLDINKSWITELETYGYKVITDTERLIQDFDYIFICVPTPTINNKISLAPLNKAVTQSLRIIQRSKRSVTIVIRSTIAPGTIDNLVFPLVKYLINTNKARLCYFPAFMREKNGAADESTPWITLLACDCILTQQKMLKLLQVKKRGLIL